MRIGKISTSSIPAADNIIEHKYENGTTWDIIKVILAADSKLSDYMCEFASQFEKSYSGLYDMWYWVHNNIKYKADSEVFDRSKGRKIQHEKIKDPRVTWADGYGDCKSFSLFIASLLRCQGIKYKYRFAAYDKEDREPKHVYVIATLNNREVILDAVHDKFDEEVDYEKKWDRMQTRISYLHGTKAPAVRTIKARPSVSERIADAPMNTAPRPNIDINGITGGQLTLELLDDQLNILIQHYGDPDGILQKARNMIFYSKKNHFHYNNTLPTGYIDPRLYDLIRQINDASKNTRINGKWYDTTIEELEYKRPTKYPRNCSDILANDKYYKDAQSGLQNIVKNGRDDRNEYDQLKKYVFAARKDVEECELSYEFSDLLAKQIDKSAHHMLYEFVEHPNELPSTVGTKAVLHKTAISSLSDLAYIDRNNVRIMAENGIMRTNSGAKAKEITPQYTLDVLRESINVNDPKARIGVFGIDDIAIIVAVISQAIKWATDFKQKMNDQRRASFESLNNGFGTKGYSPDPIDWELAKKSQTGVLDTILQYAPYALVGGAALFVLPTLFKKGK
jgi:hypothetical protein